MSEALTFEVDATGEARAEIAKMIATGHADTFQQRYARWRAVMAMVGAGMIGLIVVTLFSSVFAGSPPPWWLGFGAAIAAAWAWRLLAFRSISRLTSSLADPSAILDGPQTWTFDEDGLSIVSEVAQSRFTWRAFDRVMEGQGAIGLASGTVYFAMPLEDPDARAEVLERVEAWMTA